MVALIYKYCYNCLARKLKVRFLKVYKFSLCLIFKNIAIEIIGNGEIKMEKNMNIICKDCRNEFCFKEKIEVSDLNIDLKTAEELFATRENILSKLAESGENSKDLQQLYDAIEMQIVNLTDGNSLEAYKAMGFVNLPSRCPSCRIISKEHRSQR